ncbi:glycosyl transferase family protein [Sphingomicrobium arenosum]|uniref:glycosyl transferase family protein n=1 Tax=Sphingomicrobium arenosum TaxID=2233861 RepID=UPI002240F700|nr:glycosyl transferase family protein [Sphingomicrobium arenosum]
MSSLLPAIAAELALFAAVGFLLFALDDLLVDLLYFTRRLWRHLTVYRRYPRAFASRLDAPATPGWMAVFIPAWDEGAVIGDMLRTTLERYGTSADYLLFVGHYPNDPKTTAAITALRDSRIVPVLLPHAGPTTKADCLNHLHAALLDEEAARGRLAKAIILHDAEDVVHPLELPLFDALVLRGGAVQLPVVPLIDAASRWIGGHYCDEFAEAHGKELVVREAVGAAVPLAGVGCALNREALGRIAAYQDGRPFDADSQTEDYELGLKLGQMGLRTLFVRIPATAGSPAMVASRGHFPGSFSAAVRQKARWIGGIAFSGWDRLGWRGGLGERWMRLRDRRGPLAALLLLTGYAAFFLFAQLWIAARLGAPVTWPHEPLLETLLVINAVLLTWRVAMRALFTGMTYGLAEGLRAVPRLVVGNTIAIFAAWRALKLHLTPGPKAWDKTDHVFPREYRA